MARSKESLEKALVEIRKVRKEFWEDVKVPGKNEEFNQELEKGAACGRLPRRGRTHGPRRAPAQRILRRPLPRGVPDTRRRALRDDEHFAFVAIWEYKGENEEPVMHKEPLTFEAIKVAQRNYKD